MNRFLVFFLVSFLLHLTVGALLLSRSGILGGKGVESTELSELEEVSMEVSPSGETETKILEKKVKEVKPPPLPKLKPKKKRKKKPVKTPSASSPLEKQPPTVTKPPIVSEPVKTESDGKEMEKAVSEENPTPAESESLSEKTLEKKKEEKGQEEWVDESEIVPPTTAPASPEKAEPEEATAEEALRDVKEQESQRDLEEPKASPPIEGEEKKPDEVQNTSPPPPGSQMEKSEVPSLDVGTARMHNQLKQLEGNPLPVYPKAALKKKWEGRVEIFYYVNRAGFVEKIQLKNSSGHSVLDNAALRALSRYRYYPGQEGWVKHPVEFLLDLSEEVKEVAPLGTAPPPLQQ